MKQQFMKTAFFDFDGVVVDTEPIYDIYWNEAGKRYQTGIPNFASHIKGTTLPYILEKYFSDRSEEFKEIYKENKDKNKSAFKRSNHSLLCGSVHVHE